MIILSVRAHAHMLTGSFSLRIMCSSRCHSFTTFSKFFLIELFFFPNILHEYVEKVTV